MRDSRELKTGGFDPVDLIVGIGLAIAVPIAVWVVLRMAGVVNPKPNVAPYGDRPEVSVPPDLEEVDERLKFASRMFNENAHEFVKRCQSSRGVQQLSEKDWAVVSLRKVRAELTRLESLIGTEQENRIRFAAQLGQIALLKQRVEEDEKLLQEY